MLAPEILTRIYPSGKDHSGNGVPLIFLFDRTEDPHAAWRRVYGDEPMAALAAFSFVCEPSAFEDFHGEQILLVFLIDREEHPDAAWRRVYGDRPKPAHALFVFGLATLPAERADGVSQSHSQIFTPN